MKTHIVYSIFAILFLNSFTLADIAPPPDYQETKEVRIEVSKNYPDYTFYLCSYYTLPFEVKTHQDRFKEGEMDKSTFQANPIELTTQTPFSSDANKFNHWHLVAIKKDVEQQIKPTLKEKLMNVVSSEKNEAGIYVTHITKHSTNYKGSQTVVNNIESVDENGLKMSTSDASDGKKSRICYGFFLMLAIAFGATWISRKNK